MVYPASDTRSSRALLTGRRAGWAFVIAATLVFKSFLPLLATASAKMQGKAVADVCAVYGVRLPVANGQAHVADPHSADHTAAHTHGMHTSPGAEEAPRHDAPADHAAHAQDHCALSGLAACAIFAATLWRLADWRHADERQAFAVAEVQGVRDASARWLILRLHAPPAVG
jgi:hypothetical protein